MAVLVFYVKFVIACYIMYKLIKRTMYDRRERNPMLLFVLLFIIVVDLRNIFMNTIPQNVVYELAVLLFLLYFLSRLVGESAKTSPIMRNFIDIKMLFDSEIVERLEEGVALLKSDSLEVLAANGKFKRFFGNDNAFVTLPEIVSGLLRDENRFTIKDFDNHNQMVEARLINYGKRYALLYLKDVTKLEQMKREAAKNRHDQLRSWDRHPGFVMLRTFEGKVVYINSSFTDYLQKSRASIVNHPFSNLYEKDEEYAKHEIIHNQLINKQVDYFRDTLALTRPDNAVGFIACEELTYTFEGKEHILTTAVDVTPNYLIEQTQAFYRHVHSTGDAGATAAYALLDVIKHDVLYKERLNVFLKKPIKSLGKFIAGLSEPDQVYVLETLRGERVFEPLIVTFHESHQFFVEAALQSSDGRLLGLVVRLINPEMVKFNMTTIGSKILGHIKEGIIIINNAGEIEYSNEMIQRILNHPKEVLESKNILDISMGLTAEVMERSIEMSKKHKSLHFERIYITADGQQVPAEVVAMSLEHEGVGKVLLLIREISEKFIYKKRLIDSQSRYAQIFESMQDEFIEIKLPEKVVNFYREFDSEKGLIGMEISFLQWLNNINDHDRSEVYEAVDIITAEQKTQHIFEYRYFKGGGWLWFRATGRYVKAEDGASIIIINQNITEIKNITQKLDENRRILIESERIANTSHWKFIVSKNIFKVSETFGQLAFGKEMPDEVYYESFLESLYPSDVSYFEFKFKRFIWHGEKLDIILRLHHYGRVSYVNIIGQVYYDDEGVPIYAIGNLADVTDKTIAKQKFEESRMLLEHVVEQNAMGIVVIRNNGVIEKINHVALEYMQVSGDPPINTDGLNACFKAAFDGFSVEQLHRLLVDLEPTTLSALRGNMAFKITSKSMLDADHHYLGRILTIEELH